MLGDNGHSNSDPTPRHLDTSTSSLPDTSTPSPANPTVTYTLTRDEYMQFVRDCVIHRWAFHDYLTRFRRVFRFGAIAFFILGGFLLAVSLLPLRTGARPPVFGIVIGLLFLAGSARNVWKLFRIRHVSLRPIMQTFDRMTRSGEIRFTNGEQRVRLLPEGLLVSDQTATTMINWLFGTSRIEQTPTAIYVFTSPSTAVIIPRRAFSSAAEADHFTARARELFGARDRQQPGWRVAYYLAGRDAPCPSCNYNLRDSSGDRCPECGETLSVEAIVRAAAMGPPSA